MFAFLVGALTSGHTIACVPGELGLVEVGEAVVLVLGLPPMSHADADTRTRIQKQTALFAGDTWQFGAWALHADLRG